MANYTGTIISALASVVGLTSLFVYIHQRQKIPRLSFNGYFKREQPFVTGQLSTKVTTYYVRIEDTNPKSEGEVKSCVGSLTVGSEVYKTHWMFAKKRHNNFVKEAWLKLFDVNTKDETIGFFDATEESNVRRSPSSIGRRMGDNITMRLEAARGHCPDPHTENIEYIIKKARDF